MSWELQFVLFTILSVILLLLGHYYLRPMMKSDEPLDINNPVNSLVGRNVVAFTNFENGDGRVTVGDTQWKASTATGEPAKGDPLVVTSVAGTTLIVEPAVKA